MRNHRTRGGGEGGLCTNEDNNKSKGGGGSETGLTPIPVTEKNHMRLKSCWKRKRAPIERESPYLP